MDPTNPDFNFQDQTVTLLVADGTSANITLGYIDTIQRENIKYAIVFSIQIGACGLLILLLTMLTKPDKRRTPLFSMNLLSLALVIARSALQIQFLLGPWSTAYHFYTGDYSDISQSAITTSICTIVLQLVLNICIQVSLILQVRVVYSSTPKINLYMTFLSTTIAAVFIGVFAKVIAENINTIVNAANFVSTTYNVSKILFAFNICFFTLVFTLKLWAAIRRRKVLGLQRFGPLQIIFIMGCQTMFIPAIFSVLENVVPFDGMSSLTALFVVLSLPLSSMWASAQTDTHDLTSTYKPSNYRSFPSKTATLVTSSTMTACEPYRPDLETGVGASGNTKAVRVDKSFAVDKSSEVGPILRN